ncbi:Uncharacterized protein Adt_39837 [Abeliophyllum distichum]|uniref:Uncharacterized protein n=1 Tax=Abeliophyllum distichum TaxID=126358 RepID=A0ABD1QAG9_9LAMI
MAAKHSRREMPPSSSSKEEAPQATRIDRCPVLIGKNVDPTSFTFDAPSFYIEDLFVGMGWVSILTLNDKVDPSIIKEFYKKITFSPGTGISCLVRNKRIKITQEFIHSILHLEDGGIRLYTTKTIPHLEEYNLVKAFCRVTEKHFKILARLISFCDLVVLLSKATDTINTIILSCIKIVKEDGQWVAKSKGFDDESGPSTLPFEGGEEMDEEEDEPPLFSTSGFTEGHFNLLNG